MRKELTEAVVRRRSEKRRSQKSHKTNREIPAPEPPYQQGHRPKANPAKSPKTPPDATSPVAASELKQTDDLIKKIYETLL